MAPERTTAEKDLLKIIENPGSVQPSKKGAAGARHGASAGRKKGMLSFLDSKDATGKTVPFSLAAAMNDKKLMIKLLILATVAIFIVFIVTFAREYFKLQSLKSIEQKTLTVREPAVGTESEAATAEPEAPKAEQAAEEMPVVEQVVRNIFKPAAQQKKPVEEEKKDDLALMMQDYKLVGISIAADPAESYAMVENTKTKITMFLKNGEMFNGTQLSEITDEKLIFKAGGRQIELR